MRSKAPLTLMEQAVMVLVFALAAVLCLRVFVWSDRTSKLGAAKDIAAIKVQSAAEIIKNDGKTGSGEKDILSAAAEKIAEGGSYKIDDEKLYVGYDEKWQPAEQEGEVKYFLSVYAVDSGSDRLGAVRIEIVEKTQGETLFEITAAWQKEAG